MNYLEEIVFAQERGKAHGIASICSAHPAVLEVALKHGKETGTPVLIEATCNQVNQFGGYTGMQAQDFVRFVDQLAEQIGLPGGQVILGGDHLGPNPWQHEPTTLAMDKAKVLVRDYVQTGFSKIHLDASIKLADDPAGPLPVTVAAERAVELAVVAEDSFLSRGSGEAPRYVIGTEVPIAGGLQGEGEKLKITAVADLAETLEISRQAFLSRGLEAAWERVIAVVVQPGVEYGDASVHEYDRSKAAQLARFIEGRTLVYEAHSTDYQTRRALRQMVEDHFAILKVGPALTFAYREAIFALALMENALFPSGERSNLMEVIDTAMLANPTYWQKYYRGDEVTQRLARRYSFSDRLRYYWPSAKVRGAVNILLENMAACPLPLTLLSQYLPIQYERIRSGVLENSVHEVINDKVYDVLRDYQFACE